MLEKIKKVRKYLIEYVVTENGLKELSGSDFLTASKENDREYRRIKCNIRSMARELGVEVIKPEYDVPDFWLRTLHQVETLHKSIEETRRQVCNYNDNIRIKK